MVGLGGAITEIVYALDAGGTLVGADSSSIYPPEALKLPKVGYYRTFSVEGVASLKPNLVLASDQSGPPQAFEQLQRLGSKVVVLPSAPTLAALDQRILGVAAALDMQARGTALVDRLHAELRELKPPAQRLRVLMVSSHTGKMQAAGEETAADAMLALAGATNVLAGQTGYKPFIVTTTMSVSASGGVDKFLAQPGLNATPAARQKRVIVMDDLLLLGFGPRLPDALRQLQAGFAARPVAAAR
ncbi:Hemin-binding periplasmic protein HmuT precursor [compost metagenome]